MVCVNAINADAALYDRGGELIYDDVLNITWMQNANYAGSAMSWDNATNWADTFEYAGYNDWRLPSSDNCSGYNCAGSEMGHLFYVDNVNSGSWGLFSNIKSNVYWSSTKVDGDNARAWRFNFDNNSGNQGTSAKTSTRYAWAVRDGDSPVAPEPISSLLFIIGAATLGAKKLMRK
jgi:hypothetical protein